MAKTGSGQQGAGSSVGEGCVCVAVCNRSRGGHQCNGLPNLFRTRKM
jgi:hypothetical protein